jgi:hypothetical protein
MSSIIKYALALILISQLGYTTTIVHKNNNFDIELIDYGIYEVHRVEARKNKNTGDGRVWGVDECRLLHKTDVIPMNLLTSFGVRFILNTKLANNDINNIVPINVKVKHPKYTNPDTNKESVQEEWVSLQAPGKMTYIGYKFDHQYEMVPGEWVIELRHNNELLIEKKYNVQQVPAESK